nr:hypothetical protein [Microbispora sp. KK1-11]
MLDLSTLPGTEERYGAALVLVWPDQHVAWRGGRAEDPDPLLARVGGDDVSAA